MKVIWDRGRVTVRDVYETLRERRQIAYTTVMTMMTILDQKGFLKRSPGEGRAFVYEPARSRQAVMRATVNELAPDLQGSRGAAPRDPQEGQRVVSLSLIVGNLGSWAIQTLLLIAVTGAVLAILRVSDLTHRAMQ